MKIALLLTGQLRTYDITKQMHKNFLINNYDTDVFLSIDVVNTHQNEFKNPTEKTSLLEVEKVKDFFQPVDVFVLDDFEAQTNFLKTKALPCLDFAVSISRQFYVVQQAYKMLQNFKTKTKQEYDLIIRLRFDQLIWTDETFYLDKLQCKNENHPIANEENKNLIEKLTCNKKIIFEDEIGTDEIYVFGFGKFAHYDYVNDQFFYHRDNTKLVETFLNYYNNIPKLIKFCHENNLGNMGANFECIFFHYLKDNCILVKHSKIKGIFLRAL